MADPEEQTQEAIPYDEFQAAFGVFFFLVNFTFWNDNRLQRFFHLTRVKSNITKPVSKPMFSHQKLHASTLYVQVLNGVHCSYQQKGAHGPQMHRWPHTS